MIEPQSATVALAGAGVVGRGWIRVFAGAGAEVRLWDAAPGQAEAALAWLAGDLERDVAEGLLEPTEAAALRARVSARATAAEALEGADYLQESATERLAVKQALFAELDRLAAPDTILASSTSALDIGEIAGALPGARRCLMAHPFNPPHVLPAVEMLGTPATDPALLQRAVDFLAACGQMPVRMNRYVPGFLGNRIQAAVVREALHLVESGVADAYAVDAVIRDGLALRWATIGNFGANHANAEAGVVQYFERYGQSYATMMADLDARPPAFDPQVLAEVGAMVEAREGVGDVAALCRKRDVEVRRLRRLLGARPMSGARAVLVTGAGQSVGRVMAERFLAQGDRVFACDVNETTLAAVLAANPGLAGLPCDVADEAAVERLFDAARAAVGDIEVLVNTVGIAGPRGPIESIAPAEWRATLAANLDSMYLCIRQAVPAMRRRRAGAIVNFSSGSTRTFMPFRTPYVASKAAVEGLTRALARELGPDGIRINAVLPGMIDNDRMRAVVGRVAEQEGRTAAEVEAEYLNFVSMRSKIDPAEIAEMVLFLASDAARHVSGQLIGVCGNIEWEP